MARNAHQKICLENGRRKRLVVNIRPEAPDGWIGWSDDAAGPCIQFARVRRVLVVTGSDQRNFLEYRQNRTTESAFQPLDAPFGGKVGAIGRCRYSGNRYLIQ